MVCLPLENKRSIHLGNTARVGTLSMVLRRAERKLWHHAGISTCLTIVQYWLLTIFRPSGILS